MGAAVGERHVEPLQEDAVEAGRERGAGAERDSGDARVLGGEPPLILGEGDERLALQRRSVLRLVQRLERVAHDHRDEVGKRFRDRLMPARHFGLLRQEKPVKAVGRQRQQVGQLADRRKRRATEQLQGHAARIGLQIELDRLRVARQVDHAEDRLARMGADVGEDLAVARIDELQRAAPEGLMRAADGDEPLHPVQQRGRRAGLRLDVDGLVAVDRVHDRRQVELLRIGAAETGIAVGRPLHRRAHPVTVAEIDVVAHADLVAIVDDGRARHREEQRVHQLDLAPVVVHQRREAAADAEIDPGTTVAGVGVPEKIALVLGDHLQGQLVVVPQEHGPLAGLGNLRCLPQDVGDRRAILLRDRQIHPRHERKVERHVAFVAIAEIEMGVLGPLVGLGQQHLVGMVRIHFGANPLQDVVGLGQVLATGALPLDQVRNSVQAQPVDPQLQPVVQDTQHLAHHRRIVEVEIGLMAIETVPEIGLGFGIPGPVALLGVEEDDAGLVIFLIVVGPDVVVAETCARLGAPRSLEPGMLVRGVIDDELGDQAQATAVRLAHQPPDVRHRAVGRVDAAIILDVVAIVAQRRRVERQEPDRVDTQVRDVVELLYQPVEITDSVIVRVEERLDVRLVDDGVLVPEWVGHAQRRSAKGEAAARPGGTRRQSW